MDSTFFYCPSAGIVTTRKPPEARGGMICDEVGLGKTLSCIAFVLALQQDHVPAVFESRLDEVDCPVMQNGFVSAKVSHAPSGGYRCHITSYQRTFLRFGDVVVEGLEQLRDGYKSRRSFGEGALKIRRWPAKSTLIIASPERLDN